MPDETQTETAQPQTDSVEKKKEEMLNNGDNEKKDEEKAVEDGKNAGGGGKKAKDANAKKANKKEVAPPPPPVHKKDFEKDVVYVYQFSRNPTMPSISPYCLKVETWLKMNGIKFENIEHHNKLRSKKGLLPFIELNGEEINESEKIIAALADKFDKNMDQELTQEQKSVSHAMTTMIDNHLIWSYHSWINRDVYNSINGYKIDLQSTLDTKCPNSILLFITKHTYFKKSARKLKASGYGNYTEAEMDEMGSKDLEVLGSMLGEKEFFFGDKPHLLDLKVFVFLALILNVDKEVKCPLRDYVEDKCQNLVGVYNRVKDLSWGDHWDVSIGDKMDLNPHIPKPDPPKKEEEDEKKEKDKEEEKKEDEDKNKKEDEEKKE